MLKTPGETVNQVSYSMGANLRAYGDAEGRTFDFMTPKRGLAANELNDVHWPVIKSARGTP